ncbi:SDR family NAD(P)-dependent oxidoreductase [Dyadobacter subterraneus]|uniref:SDR family oxidoreductase n=1 Tax=Dyadobacter subterraneus TaxID=2773304 RepID=A0ABR9WEU2_9BACT|nr:SDR family oxidoreductase [Dyadobacter subterraneus]MBE9463945.1 SDR family oxidoreductase [Dyadobacter subterraneus]
MSLKLENKVAVITGGNSGIGLGVAKLFANQGAKVTITGRNASTIEKAVLEIGSGSVGVVSNVADVKSFVPLYEKVAETFGKIDVLVVNAGIILMTPLEETSEEVFDQITNINYKGVFFTVQKAHPFLNEGASIIITSSTVADKGIPGSAVYTSSKAAERNLVRSFATELAARKIRVNALSPGAIETPIFEKNGFSQEAALGMNDFFAGAVALKRLGTVDEIAKGYLFLASEDSSYMTGADLVIDGGFRDL